MNYTFKNKKNNDIKIVSMVMSEREPWLNANPDWEQIIVSMTLADPMMLGIQTKEQKEFNKHVLGRMKKGIPNNNLHHSRYGHNIGEI